MGFTVDPVAAKLYFCLRVSQNARPSLLVEAPSAGGPVRVGRANTNVVDLFYQQQARPYSFSPHSFSVILISSNAEELTRLKMDEDDDADADADADEGVGEDEDG